MSELSVVDADFWGGAATLNTLAPYLSPDWRAYLRMNPDGVQEPEPITRRLPTGVYAAPGSALAAGEDAPKAARKYLDDQGIGLAIVNPGVAAGIGAVASPYFSDELARAANRWTVETWLAVDPQLLGSIVVPSFDARLAASEVERVGEDARMVQVLLAHPRRLLGHSSFRPLYEVASARGLPVALEFGGAFTGANRGISAIGHPTSAFEHDASASYAAQPHLASMICEGTFEHHADLRLVLSGFGIAWLPSLVWRLDRELHAGRLRTPRALTRLPSEIVREHVRFTTAGLELPADPRQLTRLLDLVDGADLLIYGSGFTRSDGDGPSGLVDVLRPGWRQAVLGGNAAELFGLQISEPA